MAFATKSKESLKKVFAGVSSVLFQSTNATIVAPAGANAGTITLAPEFDLPVHVDDLSLTEDAPTVNHYKVFGLDVDWVSTSTKGDFNIDMFVPTLHEDVLKLCYGEDAVTNFNSVSGGYNGYNWSGKGIELGMHQVTGTLALLNQAQDKLLVIVNVSLWASIEFENGSTDPIGVRLTGTIETNGTNPDIIYLEKGTAVA